jgi:undecaprenyl-diphosphatase
MGRSWQPLLELDARASARLRLDPSARPAWRAAALLAHSGDSWLCMAGLALLWLLGNPSWRQLAALMAVAVGVQALGIFFIKQLVRRERPAGEWGGIYRSFDPHSFPSGHATRVVLLAVLGLALGPVWFGLLLAAWAPLVGLARVATGVHYVIDVLAGMLIGLLLGLLMLELRAPLVQLLPFLF